MRVLLSTIYLTLISKAEVSVVLEFTASQGEGLWESASA